MYNTSLIKLTFYKSFIYAITILSMFHMVTIVNVSQIANLWYNATFFVHTLQWLTLLQDWGSSAEQWLGAACGGMLTIRRSTWIQTRHGQSIFASTQQPTLQASGYYNSWPLLFMILRRREVSKPSSLSGLAADTTASPVNESFSIHFNMVLNWHLNSEIFERV